MSQIVESKLGHDTRITVLGHVQRGGAPSVADRLLGTLQGAAAVQVLLTRPHDAPALVIGIKGQRVRCTS